MGQHLGKGKDFLRLKWRVEQPVHLFGRKSLKIVIALLVFLLHKRIGEGLHLLERIKRLRLQGL